MKNKFLVGEQINLVSLSAVNEYDKVALNFKNGLFRNVFFNKSNDSDLLYQRELYADIALAIITDTGKFSLGNSQCFGTILESNLNDDVVGSFTQGLPYFDLEVKDINCFVWTIAHPLTHAIEYIEYNALKYMLSVKAISNYDKGQLITDDIDSIITNNY